MYKFDVPLKLSSFAKGLSDEFLDDLITISIAHTNSSQASKRVKLLFDTACRNEFQVKGFRSISAAANSANAAILVKKPLTDLIKRSENIAWAVLNVWFESRQKIKSICEDLLHQKNIPQIDISDLKYGFSYAILENEMENMVKELHPEPFSGDENELSLMLAVLMGQAPMSVEELKDYPGINILDPDASNADILSIDIATLPFTQSPVVSDVRKVDTSGIKEKIETLLSNQDFSTRNVSPMVLERFKDITTALSALNGRIIKAKELLSNGELSKLSELADDFKSLSTEAVIVWDKERNNFLDYVEEIKSFIRKSDLHENDKDEFIKSLDEAFQITKNNPHHFSKSRKDVDEINEEFHRILQSIKADIEKISQTEKEIDSQLHKAHQWDVPIEPWLSQITTVADAKKLPREAIERSIKINKEIAFQIHAATDAAKAKMIESLEKQVSDLQTISSEGTKHKISLIIEKLYAATTKEKLQSLSIEINRIIEEINTSLSLPDIVEAAKIYQKEPDPGYLEVLIDSLAKNRRHSDVYLLLTTLFANGIWKSGTEVEKHVIDSYFIGFKDQTPPQDTLPLLIIHLKETQLLNQIKVTDPKTRLGLAVIYLSILAVCPTALDPSNLWQIYSEDSKTLSPFWGNLLEQALQGNLPVIRGSQAVPSAELNKVSAFLDADFTKEGGKFVRTRGKNSIVMTNMEQQQLLPFLDEKWKKLKELKVGSGDWTNFKNWLSDTGPSQIFEDACHRANISSSDSPFYKTNFEERIKKDLQHFQSFIDFKEAIIIENTILLEEALNELQRIGFYSEDVYAYLAQAILSKLEEKETMDEFKEISLPFVIEKLLIQSDYYWKSMPNAVSHIGANNTLTEDGMDLLKAMVTSFIDVLHGEDLADFYLRNNLPQVAESIVNSLSIQNRADELKQKNKENLQVRLNELKKQKESLSKQEDEWLASQRWNLLFKQLDSRVDELSNQEIIKVELLRIKFSGILQESNTLDVPIMQAGFIPPASKDELHSALDDIRKICRKGIENCIPSAEILLSEIKHILDYQDANLEGVVRSHSELIDAMENRRTNNIDQKSLTAEKYVEALRSGQFDGLGFGRSTYTDLQLEDRIDLLKFWEGLKGLPVNSASLSDPQIEDLRHFFKLFAKIVKVIYSESSGSKATSYLFRKPIVHFESNLMKPGAQVLQRNLVFIALTDDINPRSLKEIDRIMDEEDWLRRGKFVVWFVLENPEFAHDWVRRRYHGKSVVVIDEAALLQILFSGDNPTSTGTFKRILLRTVDTHSVSVFWYENWVDNNKSIFVGREDWIRSIAESGESHAIYGGRRIGKSSLLKAIEGELNKAGVKSIYIDLEGARSLNGGISAAQDILERLDISDPCNTFSDFHRILTRHFKDNPDTKVVVLFDELDPYIRERRKNQENHLLIETCRNLFSEYRSNIRFVMAGFIELWKQLRNDGEISGLHNPYKNFLKDSRGPLAALQSSEAQKIVKEGFQEILGFKIQDLGIPRKIIDATTGHPAFVQKFCERLFNRMHGLGPDVTEVQLRDVEHVKEEIGPLSFTNFVVETLDLNLNSLSQIIVYLLAATKKELFSIDDIYLTLKDFDILNINREKIHESVEELKITGVFSVSSQNAYKFSVPSYATLLRQYDVTDKNYISNLIQKYNQSGSK